MPSTGEYCPYVHVFFEMTDGSYIAFFDLGDNEAAVPSPNTPAWVNHIALRMNTIEEVVDAKKRLEAAGVDVIGITDHGFIHSIYFFDPNGIRLELTTENLSDKDAAQFKASRPRRTRGLEQGKGGAGQGAGGLNAPSLNALARGVRRRTAMRRRRLTLPPGVTTTVPA